MDLHSLEAKQARKELEAHCAELERSNREMMAAVINKNSAITDLRSLLAEKGAELQAWEMGTPPQKKSQGKVNSLENQLRDAIEKIATQEAHIRP